LTTKLHSRSVQESEVLPATPQACRNLAWEGHYFRIILVLMSYLKISQCNIGDARPPRSVLRKLFCSATPIWKKLFLCDPLMGSLEP